MLDFCTFLSFISPRMAIRGVAVAAMSAALVALPYDAAFAEDGTAKNWQGFYVGISRTLDGSLGVASEVSPGRTDPDFGPIPIEGGNLSAASKEKGFSLRAGYDFQIQNWVIGAVYERDGGSVSGSSASAGNEIFVFPDEIIVPPEDRSIVLPWSSAFSFKIDKSQSLALRIGYPVNQGRTLLYGIIGRSKQDVTVSHEFLKTSLVYASVSVTGMPFIPSEPTDEPIELLTFSQVTIYELDHRANAQIRQSVNRGIFGFGVEHLLSDRLSVFVELRRQGGANLQQTTQVWTNDVLPVLVFATTNETRLKRNDLIKAGFNFRF